MINETHLMCYFELGVPLFSSNTDIEVAFVTPDPNFPLNVKRVVAYQNPPVVVLANPLVINDCTSGLICSYEGGCVYEVEADGLAQML